MNIELVQGGGADELLADGRFQAQWQTLCQRCPWATGFQTHAFARAWYSTYCHQFEPVLLLSRSGGPLEGLLALARAATGEIMPVGRHQAEYHAWISTSALGDAFPCQALQVLRSQAPSLSLLFRYLPPGTPVGWLQDPQARRLCYLRSYRRPLMRLSDGREIAASLKKSHNRNKLHALQKMGRFQFLRIGDPEQFEAVFEEMIRLYDFRHGAVQGAQPFCSTELQKAFHLALARAPGLLHVTAMKLDGRTIAAQFGVCSHGELHAGTLAHDPTLAKQSPGKLHLLLLGQMLAKEGYEQLDLTPGNDAYKERIANAWDQVHTLAVLPTPYQRTKVFLRGQLRKTSVEILRQTGIPPQHAEILLARLASPSRLPLALLRKAAAWLVSRRRSLLFVHRPPPALAGQPAERQAGAGLTIRRDSLEDLLAYQAIGNQPSRRAFLWQALRQLEAGQHVYTCKEGDRLIHVAWMAEQPQEEIAAEVLPGYRLPLDSTLIYGFQALPQPGRSGSATADPAKVLEGCLRTMLKDAGRGASARQVFLCLRAAADEQRRVVQEAGFTSVGD